MKRAAGHKVIKLREISGRPPPNFRRLFLRLRRRSTTILQHPHSLISKEKAFAVLFDLAQDDVRSFEACKLIRSQKFTDSEVYTLWRIARTLEQPMKSKVLKAVRSALRFRNCSVTPGQASLGLPFSSSPILFGQCASMVTLKNYAVYALAHSITTSRIVELAQPNIQKLAYNFKQWLCHCSQLLQHHPDLSHDRWSCRVQCFSSCSTGSYCAVFCFQLQVYGLC